jgi:hypothetical protein
MTGDVTRPPIKIPKRPQVQDVPTATDQCDRAIIVINKLELSAIQREMAQQLGIVGLFHDLKGRRRIGVSSETLSLKTSPLLKIHSRAAPTNAPWQVVASGLGSPTLLSQ